MASLLLVVGLAFCLLAMPEGALAQASKGDRAQAHYTRGIKMVKAKRYLQAAAAFARAYELVPDRSLLWNIARSYERGGDLEKARAEFQAFLRHPEVKGKMKAKAVAALARVQAAIAKKSASEKQKEALARQRAIDQARASQKSPAAKAPVGRVSQPAASNWHKPTGYTAIGVGVVALAAGAYFIKSASDIYGEADQSIATKNADDKVTNINYSDYQRKKDAMESDRRTGLYLSGGGVAAMVFGAVLLALQPNQKTLSWQLGANGDKRLLATWRF